MIYDLLNFTSQGRRRLLRDKLMSSKNNSWLEATYYIYPWIQASTIQVLKTFYSSMISDQQMGRRWDNILFDEFDSFIQYIRIKASITVSRFGWKSSNRIRTIVISLLVIPLSKIKSPGKIGWRNQTCFTLQRIASTKSFEILHVKKIQWKPIKYNFWRLLKIRDGNFGC